MDKKFLTKVLNKILSEVYLDERENKIYFPFLSIDINHLAILFMGNMEHSISPAIIGTNFYNHCRNVYGLKDEEIDFIWPIFKNIVKDSVNRAHGE